MNHLISVLLLAGVLTSDPALKSIIDVKPAVYEAGDLTQKIEAETERKVVASDRLSLPPFFIGTTGSNANTIMEEFADYWSTREYEFTWVTRGASAQPAYLLVKIARDPKRRTEDAKRDLYSALARSPTFNEQPGQHPRGNDALPARYTMIKSLPPAVLRPAVNRAFAGERVFIPLNYFHPATLAAACGGVTVFREGPDGTRISTFSTEEVLQGRGFVMLAKDPNAPSGLGLRVTIGSGNPPPGDTPVPGPSSELIYGVDTDRIVRAPATHSEASTPAPRQRKPAVRVSIAHSPPKQMGEKQIEAVLRRLTDESNLLVIATWRKDVENLPLTESLDDVTLNEAVEAIADRYQLRVERTEQALKFRTLPKHQSK